MVTKGIDETNLRYIYLFPMGFYYVLLVRIKISLFSCWTKRCESGVSVENHLPKIYTFDQIISVGLGKWIVGTCTQSFLTVCSVSCIIYRCFVSF